MVTYRTRQLHIPVAEFVEDIRTGMTDRGLMDKYGIGQQKTLMTAFDRLIATGRVTRKELDTRSSLINTQAIVKMLGLTNTIDEDE